MRIEPFDMERWQSRWENEVEINLAESGVHPLRLDELLHLAADDGGLSSLELGYGQTNGSLELRQRIASLYPGATARDVTVTHGTIEANLVSIWSLLEEGDEVALMMPNYMQIWGLARTFGVRILEFPLREACGWAPDLDRLGGQVSHKTRLIAICNPNNPTGRVLTCEEIDGIIAIARRADAWILSDEVYRGAERSGPTTPTLWGRYEKVVATGGLSKAFGLPGLRIGWVVASESFAERAWGCRDYLTIAPAALSERLARLALSPRALPLLRQRTREILSRNFPLLADWCQEHEGLVAWVAPSAGAIAFLRYQGPPSLELSERLRREHGVLVEPGSNFQRENFLRIGFGGRPEGLRKGLASLSKALLG